MQEAEGRTAVVEARQENDPAPESSADAPRTHCWEGAPVPLIRRFTKIGRNEPCPCGSLRKWKHCCGRKWTWDQVASWLQEDHSRPTRAAMLERDMPAYCIRRRLAQN